VWAAITTPFPGVEFSPQLTETERLEMRAELERAGLLARLKGDQRARAA
jgi:hypothetical protein